MAAVEANLERVRGRIRLAERAAGRPPGSVQLLAVSKTRPADDLRAALAAGQRRFGESYLQEALTKIHHLSDTDAEWHFIGPLQSNKTKIVARHFDWVHSIDRLKTARRLSEQRPSRLAPLNVCLQVNISAEAGKAGVAPERLAELAAAVHALPGLALRGLMTIPARCDDDETQRRSFCALRQALNRLRGQGLDLDTLSMGMSGDMEAAIAEGATIVRIGTDLFGARPRPAAAQAGTTR